MIHYSEKEWLTYINDEIPETMRQELEDHLFSCDHCLETYMKLVESEANQLPECKGGDHFTDQILTQLPLQKVKQKRAFSQHPLFHYGVAAAVTFVLMSTGVFQGLTGFVSTVETTGPEKSVSVNIMNKALSFFEGIELNQKEGKE